MYWRLSETILPRLGTGSLMPIPRKLNPASAKIAAGIASVIAMISGGTAFGSRWRHGHPVLGRADAARGGDVFLLAQLQDLRPHQPAERHPTRDADHERDVEHLTADEDPLERRRC